jgi:hypothetical protein
MESYMRLTESSSQAGANTDSNKRYSIWEHAFCFLQADK